MVLALAEWTTLALVREQPRHGFAVAALTAKDGAVGRIWHTPRPVVYRALGRLEEAGHVVPTAVESGAGPQRTIYQATASGRKAIDRWLAEPAGHVRDVRSHLLLKLALLDRRDLDTTALLAAQRSVLEPVVEALADRQDDVLMLWRHTNATAALGFVDQLTRRLSHDSG